METHKIFNHCGVFWYRGFLQKSDNSELQMNSVTIYANFFGVKILQSGMWIYLTLIDIKNCVFQCKILTFY